MEKIHAGQVRDRVDDGPVDRRRQGGLLGDRLRRFGHGLEAALARGGAEKLPQHLRIAHCAVPGLAHDAVAVHD
ncbi:MAG: hypothetical protein NT176_04125 [Proteobacteria bacterium]|nr:hypothetical protein [Pseudomonadota bacterium]